ncbi:hypothetical protein [Pedobacter sp.]|jgi:hypothetical protein|uniref:hypothetical protein n=1 Tax=Pedobacter sp. TaxID=1411316 RepID=UPI002BDEA4AD|nr:hypothetical protein [Pedobacter sp.]HWW38906.1 hypothetical protein [Pedobacter sp.]
MKYFVILSFIIFCFSSCTKHENINYPNIVLKRSAEPRLSMMCGPYAINATGTLATLKGYNIFDTVNHYFVITAIGGDGYLLTVKLYCQQLKSGTYQLDNKNGEVTLSRAISQSGYYEVAYAQSGAVTLNLQVNGFTQISGDFSGNLVDMGSGRQIQFDCGFSNLYIYWVS